MLSRREGKGRFIQLYLPTGAAQLKQHVPVTKPVQSKKQDAALPWVQVNWLGGAYMHRHPKGCECCVRKAAGYTT
eukprot:scaffold52962_cov18-Tisochrysis_lutea.AAC.4